MPLVIRNVLAEPQLCSLPSLACSFVRDSLERCVPVTPPIVLRLQGLPTKKPCCWPRVPLLASVPTL